MSMVLALLLLGQPAPAGAPADALQLVQQGRRAVAVGKHAVGLALYEKALAAQPQLPEAHLGAGIVLDLMGEYSRAREHLTKAIEQASPELRSNALQAMAVSHAFERHAPEAARFFQQIYDANVEGGQFAAAAGTANALGRLYLEVGDTKQARRWYETGYEMARRQPDEPGSQLALWRFRWLHALGRIAAREGKSAEARKQVAAARELVEATPSLKEEGPTLAYLAGYVELHLKNYATARTELARADQEDPFILMLQAQAAEKAGDPTAARGFWEKALESNAHSLQNAFARPLAKKAVR